MRHELKEELASTLASSNADDVKAAVEGLDESVRHKLCTALATPAAQDRQAEAEDYDCAICTETLADVGGAIKLPCQCRIPYCHKCWDRTLASSLSKIGLPRCPSCRCAIRVDYDSSGGMLTFSRVAEITVQFSPSWESAVDDAASSHDAARTDEADKFVVTDQSGRPILLWTRLYCVYSWERHEKKPLPGFLEEWRSREGLTQAEVLADLLLMDKGGTHMFDPSLLTEDQFPITARFPKHPATLLREITQPCFPLTLRFKEYIINVDHSENPFDEYLPAVDVIFRLTDGGALMVNSGNVGLLGRWKDSESGLQLHPDDLIIEVNSVQGNAEELIVELRKRTRLKIKIRQKDFVARVDVYNPNNNIRARLSAQTRPKQLELLQSCRLVGVTSCDGAPSYERPPSCICGGELERLQLRERLHRLVEPRGAHGVFVYGGRTHTVEQLLAMGAVDCDLCSKKIEPESLVWTCDNGSNTVLHAQSYDICDDCFRTHTGQGDL